MKKYRYNIFNRAIQSIKKLTFLILGSFITISANAQLGEWDGTVDELGTTNFIYHGNSVVQLLNSPMPGAELGAAVHETSNPYNPSTDSVFNECYQVFFGCNVDGGDGMAFSFTEKPCGFTVGRGAGGLGYAGSDQCSNKMITIEFDVFLNNFDSPFDNATESEVAIHRNAIAEAAGRITAETTVGNLDDGLEHEVCISYDPNTGFMKVDIDGTEVLNYELENADRLENYFSDGAELTQTWSAGQQGAVIPATVSKGADISETIGKPLCPSSVLVTFPTEDTTIGECDLPITLTAVGEPPINQTITQVEFFVDGNSVGTTTTPGPNTFEFDWTPPTIPQTYSVTAIASFDGGLSATSEPVGFSVEPNPNANAGLDASFCEGSTGVTLNASGGTTYSWSPTNGLSNPNIANPVATPTTTTTYTVTVSNGSCSATDDVTVTVNSKPAAPTAGSNSPVCEGTSLSLTANTIAGATYSWTGPGTFTSADQNPTVSNTATLAMAGTYTVIATSNNCDSDPATTTVAVSECSCPAFGTISASGPTQVCPGETSTMEVVFGTNNGSGPFDIILTEPVSGDRTITNATSPLPINISEIGAYSVSIVDKGNASCTVSATGEVSLSNFDTPTAEIKGGGSICNDGLSTVTLEVTFTGTAPFQFDVLNDGIAFSSETTSDNPASLDVSDDGTYTITNFSDANCDGTVTASSATVSYFENVQAVAIAECDNSLGEEEFQIRVTVSQGDLSTINITSTPMITFTPQGGGIWLSDPVNETVSVDLNVTDENDCNGGEDFIGLNKVCSCPTNAMISISGKNPICENETTLLEVTFNGGTGPFDVEIMGPSGIVSTQNGQPEGSVSVDISEAGNYSAKVTNTAAGEVCDANTQSITLELSKPSANAGADIEICEGEEALLNGSGTGNNLSFAWSPIASISGSTTSASTRATPTENTVYILTVTDEADCDASDEVSVTVSAKPSVSNTILTQTICSAERTSGFILESDIAGSSFTWTSTSNLANGATASGTGNIPAEILTAVTNTTNGQVVYSVTPTSNGCDGDKTDFIIDVLFTPAVNAKANNVNPIFATPSAVVQLAGSHNGDVVTWTSNVGVIDDPSNLMTSIVIPEDGLYYATLTSSNGQCAASDSVRIIISKPLSIPNAFSPNGDGVNDFWEIEGMSKFGDANVSVFNRWGSKIFEASGGYFEQEDLWDGGDFPDGTYYYVIQFNTKDFETPDAVGSVTITR